MKLNRYTNCKETRDSSVYVYLYRATGLQFDMSDIDTVECLWHTSVIIKCILIAPRLPKLCRIRSYFTRLLQLKNSNGTHTPRDFGFASALVTYWFCTCLTNRLRTWDNYR